MSLSARFRYIGRAVAVMLLSVLTVWAVLWLYLLGPVGYLPPQSMDYSAKSYDVFAYGTLKQPWIRRFIIGRTVHVHEDSLSGYQRDGLDLQPDPAFTTIGLRFVVTPKEMRRLDRYERLGVRYQREQLLLDSGHKAWVYRRIVVE